MERMGPLHLLAISVPHFPGQAQIDQFMKRADVEGSARLVDLAVIAKDRDGALTMFESNVWYPGTLLRPGFLSRLISVGQQEQAPPDDSGEVLKPERAFGDFGLTAGDIELVLDSVPRESLGLLLLTIDPWMTELREHIRGFGGVLFASGLVSVNEITLFRA